MENSDRSETVISRAALALFVVALLIAALGTCRSSFLPERQFLAGTIVDDAVYNLVAAQNLLQGHEYSLDKTHRTNGVQPLWALFSIALVALCSDRVTAMRLLVLAGGLLWLLAGAILFYSLRRVNILVALIASIFWLFAAFTQRIALQGMENGLTALCLASIVAIGVHFLYGRSSADEPAPRGFYWLLGLALGMFSLCRVEMVLLTLLFSVGGLLGWWRRGGPWRVRTLDAVALALPTGILFGSYVLLNLTYFGALLPVSGAVKRFYNQEWIRQSGYPFGGLWGNLWFHLKYPWEIATFAFSGSADRFFFRAFGVAVTLARAQTVLNVGVIIGVARWLMAGLPATASSRRRFWMLLWVFVLTHLLLLAVWNPYFTRYGTWYFTPQIMAACIVVGAATLGLARLLAQVAGRVTRMPFERAAAWLVIVVAGLVVIINASYRAGLTDIDPRGSMLLTFKRAGEWLNWRLPGTQHVATISSGFVSQFAPNHRVSNLDGVINDHTYYDKYLKLGRVAEYLRQEKFGYFADYAPAEQWKRGIAWQGNIPLSELQLLRWWLVPNTEYAYVIFRLMPPGSRRDPLDPGPAPCDRISQIQFAAIALKRFAVINDPDLQGYLQAHPGSVVAASFLRKLEGPLEHVVMPLSQFRSLALKPEDLDINNRLRVRFRAGADLLGFDVSDWTVGRGQLLSCTAYWSSFGILRGPTVKVWISIEGAVAETRDPGAHGSLPFHQRQAGDVLAETHALRVPAAVTPGLYPIRLGLRSESSGWIPHDGPQDRDQPGTIFLGNLEVR